MVDYEDLTNEQQRAVDALDRNVTLTAGAGTGKTTTLTARYLKMFEQSLESSERDGADHLLPENVLTTTFTERGANELEESIRSEITDRIGDGDVDDFEAWRTIADELEHGYIHTLHGFCARLLREHAVMIDQIDPGFDTLDEDDTAALIDDTVGTVLEEYENHDATQTLARRFSRGQLHDVLADLLEERPDSLEWANRWADASEDEYLEFVEAELHPINPDEAADRLAQEAFVTAAETLTAIVDDPPDIDTGGQAWGRAAGVVDLLEEGFADGVPSRSKQTLIAQLSMHLTTGDGERYASYTAASSRWGDHPRKEEFDTAFETLVEALEPEQHAVDVDIEREAGSFPFVTALAELTRIAIAEYEDRKDRQNVVDFTDQVTYAVEFLAADENGDIRRTLRDQFDYVMVDEFQDTDPRQWDLIKLLTTGDGETFDARNVFVVGDVKQSIYRFRNADVTQFRETANTLEESASVMSSGEADSDQLSTNFRTLPIVLETVNELFEAVFDEDGEPYEAAPQSLSPDRNDPADIGSVEYLAVPTDADLREQRFDHYDEFANAEPDHDVELEAMALAARLSQILAEPYQVYPGEDEDSDTGNESTEDESSQPESHSEPDEEEQPEPRDIEPNDITILIRSRTHLKKYERALDDHNVPYSVASGVGFYESPEITALLNLFRSLADPSDERALYATLRSPLFGLTDDTLAELKLRDDPLWEALAASDTDELATVHDFLTRWRQLAGLEDDKETGLDDSWAAYLTQILEDTGYLVNISADERPHQARANVEKFREQLRTLTDDGIRSLTTLVARLERRIDLGGRESEAETTDEGVQIMTIHDAKGMEFPFVVVPGISRSFNDEAALGSGQVEFEKVGDQHAVGMKAPEPDNPFEMADTIARDTLRDRRRAEEHAEEKRVLYVACTRARDHLLLTGRHEVDDHDTEPAMTALDPGDSEDASSWRDWVQPELLTEDVCIDLEDSLRVEREYGDGAYAVTLPRPGGEFDRPEPDTAPEVKLSPEPPQPSPSFHLSATDYAAIVAGYADLHIDQETRLVYVEHLDEQAERPDTRHGEKVAGQEEVTTTQQEQEDTRAELDVKPRVFGEMVHRICELSPPEDQWQQVMEQTLADEGARTSLTPDLEERVRQHAQRGLAYIDDLVAEAESDDIIQYDELYVTAEFDSGEISGYIDHLLVTPESYHIVDYKTGDMEQEDIAEEAEYYKNQMKAYAIALYQQRTGRPVRVSLVFTEIDEIWETEWTVSDIELMEHEIRDEFKML